jgi:hypothetical protein
MIDLRVHDWSADRIFDSTITSHGFAPYMRDYDVIAEVPALRPDGSASYIEGRYRYRITHCVEASLVTGVSPETWHSHGVSTGIEKCASIRKRIVRQ